MLEIITSTCPDFRNRFTTEISASDISTMDDDSDLPSGQPKLIDAEKPAVEPALPFNKIYWVNLREEPVIYIDGSPYSPRDVSYSITQSICLRLFREKL